MSKWSLSVVGGLMVTRLLATYPIIALVFVGVIIIAVVATKYNAKKRQKKLEEEDLQRISSDEFQYEDMQSLSTMNFFRIVDEGNKRIFFESTQIMDTTKNLDVFLERFRIILEVADRASKYNGLNYLLLTKAIILRFPNALNCCIDRVIGDASLLKTAKGRINRYKKNIEILRAAVLPEYVSDLFFEIEEQILRLELEIEAEKKWCLNNAKEDILMGLFSSKEEKMQKLMEELELENLSERDYKLAKAASTYQTLAIGNGVTTLNNTELAKISALEAIMYQNWLIIRQLNEINQKLQD